MAYYEHYRSPATVTGGGGGGGSPQPRTPLMAPSSAAPLHSPSANYRWAAEPHLPAAGASPSIGAAGRSRSGGGDGSLRRQHSVTAQTTNTMVRSSGQSPHSRQQHGPAQHGGAAQLMGGAAAGVRAPAMARYSGGFSPISPLSPTAEFNTEAAAAWPERPPQHTLAAPYSDPSRRPPSAVAPGGFGRPPPTSTTASPSSRNRSPMASEVDPFFEPGHVVERVDHATGRTQARYVLGHTLGTGAFAQVFEATEHLHCISTTLIESQRTVAVKAVHTVPPPLTGDVKHDQHQERRHATMLEKLRYERAIHAKLQHPHVLRLTQSFSDRRYTYLVLELCPNGSLLDVSKDLGPLRFDDARYYLLQLLTALDYLHRGNVLHRDLKLANLLIDADYKLKVADFGFASELTHNGDKKRTVCGTPNYIAPEILLSGQQRSSMAASSSTSPLRSPTVPQSPTGRKSPPAPAGSPLNQPASGRSSPLLDMGASAVPPADGYSTSADIWSFGVVMAALFTGRPPFETKSVEDTYDRIRRCQYQLPSYVPPVAAGLIRSILQLQPEHRPSLLDIRRDSFFNGCHIDDPPPASVRQYFDSRRGAATPKEIPPNVTSPARHTDVAADRDLTLVSARSAPPPTAQPPLSRLSSPLAAPGGASPTCLAAAGQFSPHGAAPAAAAAPRVASSPPPLSFHTTPSYGEPVVAGAAVAHRTSSGATPSHQRFAAPSVPPGAAFGPLALSPVSPLDPTPRREDPLLPFPTSASSPSRMMPAGLASQPLAAVVVALPMGHSATVGGSEALSEIQSDLRNDIARRAPPPSGAGRHPPPPPPPFVAEHAVFPRYGLVYRMVHAAAPSSTRGVPYDGGIRQEWANDDDDDDVRFDDPFRVGMAAATGGAWGPLHMQPRGGGDEERREEAMMREICSGGRMSSSRLSGGTYGASHSRPGVVIGALFNDRSRMLWHPAWDHIEYTCRALPPPVSTAASASTTTAGGGGGAPPPQREEVSTRFSIHNYPAAEKKKCTLIQHFRGAVSRHCPTFQAASCAAAADAVLQWSPPPVPQHYGAGTAAAAGSANHRWLMLDAAVPAPDTDSNDRSACSLVGAPSTALRFAGPRRGLENDAVRNFSCGSVFLSTSSSTDAVLSRGAKEERVAGGGRGGGPEAAVTTVRGVHCAVFRLAGGDLQVSFFHVRGDEAHQRGLDDPSAHSAINDASVYDTATAMVLLYGSSSTLSAPGRSHQSAGGRSSGGGAVPVEFASTAAGGTHWSHVTAVGDFSALAPLITMAAGGAADDYPSTTSSFPSASSTSATVKRSTAVSRAIDEVQRWCDPSQTQPSPTDFAGAAAAAGASTTIMLSANASDAAPPPGHAAPLGHAGRGRVPIAGREAGDSCASPTVGPFLSHDPPGERDAMSYLRLALEATTRVVLELVPGPDRRSRHHRPVAEPLQAALP